MRSIIATHRARRNTWTPGAYRGADGYRTNALVTLKAKRRTLHWQDVRNALDAFEKDGSRDDTEADGYFVMGTAYGETLRDGEVSVGIVAI